MYYFATSQSVSKSVDLLLVSCGSLEYPQGKLQIIHQKQNFHFYYAVVKYRLLERLRKQEKKKGIICLVNFLQVGITENRYI